jgi:hypothetical protein
MIIISKGVEIIIDDNIKNVVDIKKIKYDNSNGYARIGSKYLHRILINAKEGEVVDHINGNRVDNRLENLRIVTKSLNNYNRVTSNKYGRGIYFDKYGNRFRAVISHNNKTEKLGSFKTLQDAQKKYNERAFEIYGNDAKLHTIS